MERSPAARIALLAAVVLLGSASAALAQVRQPGQTLSAGEHAGPLSDVSRPLDDSPSMHDGAQTLGETSGGPVGSGPVRDAGTRSMLSGAVSDVSQGPMFQPRPPLSGGAVAEASAGAVKHDIDSPLGERISSPLRELGPLQQAMRARREQAEQAALAGAMEPAAPPIDAQAVREEPVAPLDAQRLPGEAPAAPEGQHADVSPQQRPSGDADATEEPQPAE